MIGSDLHFFKETVGYFAALGEAVPDNAHCIFFTKDFDIDFRISKCAVKIKGENMATMPFNECLRQEITGENFG